MKKLLFLLILLPVAAFAQPSGHVISDQPTGLTITGDTLSKYSLYNIAQTTAGQTITIANKFTSSNIYQIQVNNTGSASFTLSPGGTIASGTGTLLRWTGSAWNITALGTGSGGGGGGAVSSVFGRTGAVVATSGDYNVSQITNAVSSTDATYVKSVVLNTPNVLYSTPINFTTATNTATGTLSLNTQSANTVFCGPSSGAAATPSFRALVAGDIPSLSSSYVTTVNGSSGAISNVVTGSGSSLQVGVWNGTNSQTGYSGLQYNNTSNFLGIGGTPSAVIHAQGSVTAGAWALNGIGIRYAPSTFIDNTSSGTVATNAIYALGAPTLQASSATTYTNAYSLYVGGAPISSTNVTQTNSWAAGFGAQIYINGAVAAVGSVNLSGATRYIGTTDANILNIMTGGTSRLQFASTGNALFQNLTNVTLPHLVGGTSSPTIAAGTGAGTSPTVSITKGTDLSGVINVTTGTTPTAAAAVVTVTFNTAYTSAPKVIIQDGNVNAASLNGVNMVYVDDANTTTTQFVLTAGPTGLTAATTYKWYYTITQ